MQVKLSDFGISRKLTSGPLSTAVGTQYYMSPERATGGEYDVNADVWSLGCVAYEMATKTHPFEDAEHRGPVEVISDICMKDPESMGFAGAARALIHAQSRRASRRHFRTSSACASSRTRRRGLARHSFCRTRSFSSTLVPLMVTSQPGLGSCRRCGSVSNTPCVHDADVKTSKHERGVGPQRTGLHRSGLWPAPITHAHRPKGGVSR